MTLVKVQETYRTQLLQLIQDTKAYFPSEPLESVFPIVQGTDYLFELDRLWSNADSFNKIVNLLTSFIKSLKIQHSTIVGLTSRTGAFGTVPICAGVSLKSKKNLLVFDEERFSNFVVHPDGNEMEKGLKGKKIFLIKDVVLRGDTIERVLNTIRKLDADLVGLIVLVDLNLTDPDENRYSTVPKNIPIYIIAEGPFPELRIQ